MSNSKLTVAPALPLERVFKLPVVISDAVWAHYVQQAGSQGDANRAQSDMERLACLLQALYRALINDPNATPIFYAIDGDACVEKMHKKKNILLKAVTDVINNEQSTIRVMLPEEV